MLRDVWKWNAATTAIMIIAGVFELLMLGDEKVGKIMSATDIVFLVGIVVAILNFGATSPITSTVAAVGLLIGGTVDWLKTETVGLDLTFPLSILGGAIFFPLMAAYEARKEDAKEDFFSIFITAFPCIGIFAGEILRFRKPKT